MGINTAMVHHATASPELLDSKMPFYVENMINKGLCLKWNSRVSDWDRHVTAWKTPRDEAGLIREYCLDDPQWRAWSMGEMQRLVRANAPYQPLAYDIRDELSTTMSANPFDYDLRSGKYLGATDALKIHLDPWQPSLFALLPQRIPDDDVLRALIQLADKS